MYCVCSVKFSVHYALWGVECKNCNSAHCEERVRYGRLENNLEFANNRTHTKTFIKINLLGIFIYICICCCHLGHNCLCHDILVVVFLVLLLLQHLKNLPWQSRQLLISENFFLIFKGILTWLGEKPRLAQGWPQGQPGC